MATVVTEDLADPWIPADHLFLIDELLVRMATGQTEKKKALIKMPPRHGKSELCSKYFPAWHMGRFPDHPILFGSYEAGFASDWGAKARDIISEHGPELFKIELDPDNRSQSKWGVKGRKGTMVTAGVGGAFTGRGAKVLLVDDPVKNAEQANSAVYREKTADWFKSTALTRLEPGGIVIVIMTQWHEDDLAGRIERGAFGPAEEWMVLSLAAIAEEPQKRKDGTYLIPPDPLNRDPGQALWPARYDENALRSIRRTVTDYWWASLYQQRPQPPGGAMFKRAHFRYFHVEDDAFVLHGSDGTTRHIMKSACRIFQAVDSATKTGEHNSQTSVVTFVACRSGEVLILDAFADQVEVPDLWDTVIGLRDRFEAEFQGIEDKSSGTGLIQKAQREREPVEALKAGTDKVARATPLSIAYKNGMVYHLEAAPWLDSFENELLAFPLGARNDQVDAAAHGWSIAADMPMLSVRPMPNPDKPKIDDDPFESLMNPTRRNPLDHLTPNKPGR